MQSSGLAWWFERMTQQTDSLFATDVRRLCRCSNCFKYLSYLSYQSKYPIKIRPPRKKAQKTDHKSNILRCPNQDHHLLLPTWPLCLVTDFWSQDTEAVVTRFDGLPQLTELTLKRVNQSEAETESEPENKVAAKALSNAKAHGFIEACCWALQNVQGLQILHLECKHDRVKLYR